jgi:hypothetical protein
MREEYTKITTKKALADEGKHCHAEKYSAFRKVIFSSVRSQCHHL